MEQLQNYIDAIVRTDWVTTAISAVVILAITAVVARLTRRFLGRVLAINEERDLPQAPSSSTSPAEPCGSPACASCCPPASAWT